MAHAHDFQEITCRLESSYARARFSTHLQKDPRRLLRHQPPTHNDPQKNQKIRAEEDESIHLISRTLLEALRNDPSKQLSNDSVDALIKTSQADDTPAHVEVELLELAKLNRPQGQRLSQLLEQAQIKKHQA